MLYGGGSNFGSAVEVLIIIIRRGKWGTELTQCLRAATTGIATQAASAGLALTPPIPCLPYEVHAASSGGQTAAAAGLTVDS